jgi:hypothetical protein
VSFESSHLFRRGEPGTLDGALAFTVSAVPLAVEIHPVVARSLLFGMQLGFQGGDPFLEGGNVRLVIRWLAPGCRVVLDFREVDRDQGLVAVIGT